MDEETDQESIKSKLSSMSFEELQKLKEEIGAKLYNEQVLNVKTRKVRSEFKRANKNRPREMSSKRPVPIAQNVVPVKKTVVRDPRFDPLCGTFDEKTFKSNYRFVEKMKVKERDLLVKELEETEDDKRKKKIKYLIQRIDNQERERKRKEKKPEGFTVDDKGKRQFQKKSEKRTIDLIGRYEELKQTKKLHKHIEKKSKKKALKEKKSNKF